MDVNSLSESLSHQDVINLIVVFPIWAVLYLSSGWFVRTSGVCQYMYLVVKSCKLQKSEASFLSEHCSRAHKRLPSLPVHPSVLQHSNSLVQLERSFFGVFLRFPVVASRSGQPVSLSRCWCIGMYDGDTERAALKRIEISLLETGRHPKTALIMFLCTRSHSPFSCLSSSTMK